MGFEKWLYRNGPGSPGHTARTLVKWYHNNKAANHGELDDNEAYLAIFFERLAWQVKLKNSGCLLSQFSIQIGDIIAEKDMPLFVFAIESLETKQFRFGISNRNIDIVLEVIREEVEKLDRTLIRLGYTEYRNKAIDFLNSVLDYANQNK